MKLPRFYIAQLVSFPGDNKFRIIEVTPTIDGPRWRVAEGVFASQQHAEDYLKGKMKKEEVRKP